MKLLLLKDRFAICSLSPSAALPAWLNYQGYGFVSRTQDELCIICTETMAPEAARTESGWRCLRIDKPADSVVRTVRADIVSFISGGGYRSLTLSTYNTDYVIFTEVDRAEIIRLIEQHGYEVAGEI